jgi:Rps23 Pro-64 3,4-dihydroxylase Tpa1-like proline 4-hydroxylase
MIHIIEDFLPPAVAESLSQSIYDTPENWWSTVYADGINPPVYLNNTLENRKMKNIYDTKVNDSFINSNNVVYRFKRSTEHIKECSCYECSFRENYLKGEKFSDILYSTMSMSNPVLFESFVSSYERGDFLNVHTDEKRGVAFILNLTKDWKPEYGGLLTLLDKGDKMNSIFPKFNSLILFKLGDKGVPHFVSEVSSRAPHARIAISGWFNDE